MYIRDAFVLSMTRPVDILDLGKIAMVLILTFSFILFKISEDKALRLPIKNILVRVMARVIHCWKRRRYKSASL